MSQEGQSGRGDLHAMVLSGSGCSSTAIYEVGVIKALMEEGCGHLGGRPLDPDIYSGSGFGAFNASILASQTGGDTASALRYLEGAWLEGLCTTPDKCGNGVFRLRANPFIFLNPRCYSPMPLQPFIDAMQDFAYLSTDLLKRLRYFLGQDVPWSERLLSIPDLTPFFDMAPLQEQLSKHVDLERLRSSDKDLLVMASDWAMGRPRVFTKAEMTDQQGHAILQASATFLLAFPFVEIGGKPFGGAPGTMATPLKPVIDTFANTSRRLHIHVIFLDPPLEDIPIDQVSSSLGGLGRWFSINESVNIRAQPVYASEEQTQQGHHQRAKPDANVTIHHYRPSKPLVNWFDFANFERKQAEAYMARGYSDARGHDCQAEGCILAA